MHFCIVGSGRCGTTLLHRFFNLHPDIFIYNETHWIPKMYEKFGTGPAPVHELIHIIENTYPVTDLPKESLRTLFKPDEITTVKKFCDLTGLQFARKNEKTIWADKTPDYGPYMHIIQKLWPECKFIHLIRHGADVSVSMSKHPGYQILCSAREDNWIPLSYNGYHESISLTDNSFSDYSSLWYRRLNRIRIESELLAYGTYVEIKYEDLIQYPDDILSSLANYLNIACPGNWIKESRAMIKMRRFKKRIRNRDMTFLSEQERDLLNELEYD